ncbi:ABC-2 transporter permease [Lentibacillus cibarius]|uniref:Uncharacterized protein n=1 Tax=Lentibacillus cibarius TaxID=2583219 RepID=A0A5S3QRT4_9BACI|nr:ABC-2 transporter permease [Lentibacillus cibarius]TMN23366.1 hypothetical protein FFL34_15630 [Lentibacillus cibarius]
MRAGAIFRFVKEEWYSQRRMLLWYMVWTLLLDIALLICSQLEWVLQQVRQSALSFGQFSLSVFAILFIPYAISWVILVYKVDKEKRTGFYTFVHTLPITIKEVVTAKYISVFLMNGLMFGWLSMLWRLYEVSVRDAASLQAWTGLCMVGFLIAFGMSAIQLGIFFHWGGTSLALLLVLIVGNQLDVADQLADQTMAWMAGTPLLTWGVTLLIVGCIWSLCWRWSLKAYRKYE